MFLMACLFSISHVLRWNGGIDVYECLREENTALKVEAFFVLGNEFSRACFVWEAKSRNLHISCAERYCVPSLVTSRV